MSLAISTVGTEKKSTEGNLHDERRVKNQQSAKIEYKRIINNATSTPKQAL